MELTTIVEFHRGKKVLPNICVGTFEGEKTQRLLAQRHPRVSLGESAVQFSLGTATLTSTAAKISALA